MKHKALWITLIIVVLAATPAYFLWDSISAQAKITQLTNELNRDPKNFDAAYGLGETYFRIRKYDKSVEFYTKAAQINQASVQAVNNLGNAYRKLSRYEDAERQYLHALELSGTYITAYTNLVSLYYLWAKAGSEEKLGEVPKVLTIAIEKNPNNPVLLQSLIDYYKSIKDTANAAKYQTQLDAL